MLLRLMLADGGRELLNAPVLNYTHGNLDAVGEMLHHPTSAFGLGDGGAHAGQTCDASTTTFLLTHWSRDRDHGRLSVEEAVHKMTQATATLYGLGDRGVLAPGFVGDANVIDYERLQLRRPELVSDLPAGASRLVQQADGYLSTIKSGVRTFVAGEDTGARARRPAPRRAVSASPTDTAAAFWAALYDRDWPRIRSFFGPDSDLLRRAHRSVERRRRPGQHRGRACGSVSRDSSATSTGPGWWPRVPTASW